MTVDAAFALFKRFWWIIPIAGLAIALFFTRATLADRTEDRDRWQASAQLQLEAVRAASGSPNLILRDAPAQIAALGRSIMTLRDGLERCTASARAHEANDARRQQEAATALQAAEERAAAGAGVIARLRASAAAGRPPGGECEPSETVREIWR